MEDKQEAANQNWHLFLLDTPKPKHFEHYGKALSEKIEAYYSAPRDDPQYNLLSDCGMPKDKRPLIATMPGYFYGDEFKEFSIEFFGVEGPPPPEIANIELKIFGRVYGNSFSSDAGVAGGYITVEVPAGKIEIELWRCRIYLNKSSLCLEMIWRGGGLGWGEHIVSLRFEPEEQYRRMLTAVRLRNAIMAEVTAKRRRGLTLAAEQFLQQGLKAAEDAARSGAGDLTFTAIAPFFAKLGRIRNRETISDHSDAYPDEWAKINQKFSETKEWLKYNNPKQKDR